MQLVSGDYKEQIKKPLRNRGYIMVTFGLINQHAQSLAKVQTDATAIYSKSTSVFGEKQFNNEYARLDEDYIKVNGSQFFPPRKASNTKYDTGIVSDKNVKDAEFKIKISLGDTRMDLKGISIDFGSSIPKVFTIESNGGTKLDITDNTLSLYKTEQVFNNTNVINITIREMVKQNRRATLKSIVFGYGLVYHNDDVIDSTLTSYTSPIGADVPQIDFSIKLDNHSHYFNVDNPSSAINYLETGQPMDIAYGYELDNGSIEWVKGNHLYCSSWESDDFSATIKCQDIFRSMDEDFNKGKITGFNVSYYDLAVQVLEDAGITQYNIDPYLKSIFSKNPIPRVKHKEALQIIANATRSVLEQDRNGKIVIDAAFNPSLVMVAPTGSKYGDMSNISNSNIKPRFANLTKDYMTVDGSMVFPPREILPDSKLDLAYYSVETSNDIGEFIGTKPVLEIKKNVSSNGFGLNLEFGDALPERFIVETFNDSIQLFRYEIDEREITQKTYLPIELGDFTKIKIMFLKTKIPFNRIVVNSISIGKVNDFSISKNDVVGSLKAIKQELVKNVIVPYVKYSKVKDISTLETVSNKTSTIGETETIYFSEPAYDYTVTFAGSNNILIVDSGAFFITIKYLTATKGDLEVKGKIYKKIERQLSIALNTSGKTITWANPMIDNYNDARRLGQWLGEYYSGNIEYEYKYRGNPELDTNDLISQENNFIDDMTVKVYRHTFNFNTSFSGKITARRTEV